MADTTDLAFTEVVRGTKRTLGVAATAVAAVLVSGCGLSSLTSGLGNSMFGGSSDQQVQVDAVTEEQLLSAAKADYSGTGPAGVGGGIAHGCPKFQVNTTDKHLTIYEEGRVGDGLAIKHRGEITKTARECFIETGRVTVKYGFSGRVLLGPKGVAGPLTFPVNVSVADAARTPVASDQLTVSVNVAADKPIGYFSAVRSITFDVAQGSRPGEYQVQVAFDRTIPGAG
ncbi:MAG: hypothetical protein AAFO75_01565 [Pseudomonadota bacterium]